MAKSLEIAIAEVAALPEAGQEEIGQRLLSHVEKLRLLRAEIDKGVASLDAGKGEKLDIEEFLRLKNASPQTQETPLAAARDRKGRDV